MKHAWLALSLGTAVTILAALSDSLWWILAWPLYVCLVFVVSVVADQWWAARHPDKDWPVDL